jgi:hypothetical protein
MRLPDRNVRPIGFLNRGIHPRFQTKKEDMMKRFIYLTVVLMVGFMLIGCSGMTAEQRKETYDLNKSVGNRAFVGDTSPEARGVAYYQMHGR